MGSDCCIRHKELIAIVESSEWLKSILIAARSLGLDNYYIGAGCIAQTVWNRKFGKIINYGIKDVDFVYYDFENIGEDSENKIRSRAESVFSFIEHEIDVKNQARVHIWYKEKFGYEINPYESLESAIDSWPTTATSLGMRIGANGEYLIYAPYGIEDLLEGKIRANKVQITKEIYEKKAQAWKKKWPDLEVISWEES